MTIDERNKLIADMFELYAPKIATLARRMIQDREVAREAAQEVWFQIINSVKSFRGESAIGTWIYSVARRTIARYAQNEKEYTHNDIEEYLSLPEIPYDGEKERYEDWVHDKCYECLTAFCHCLGSEERMIFIFRDILELPYHEISMIMEIGEDSVRQKVSRSRKKMKNYLGKNCVLYNPGAKCRCRMEKHVTSESISAAYRDIRKTVRLVRFFSESEKRVPSKDFLEKMIRDVTD
ncbi:MAG TPA: RNA polymerase sigma factor [Spirochaetota bacterium]|nr:RNA polymerase sigma factor [Spirochaetota bacterium]